MTPARPGGATRASGGVEGAAAVTVLMPSTVGWVPRWVNVDTVNLIPKW